ncbi:MAG: hypothetical protein GY727_00305 [Gammaproteobacteria bacterium]|nr:hypothetical protein [Gammaproteobacteria bacterium]MCP4091006.1 hypothetical protein [Gammaproteobacteria bacterium]MCP4277468.1 hypothetical protein [Gammaproteobacteria bacterium]MCP4831471.1 hypothetical protein [Gammaproteobacteria bacterium]MCP4927694.1 hypothetical protein [Gammaproteobacteria bacterium]
MHKANTESLCISNTQGWNLQGYSLIDLLITMTILIIIISFALPGWQQLLTAARRHYATTTLTQLATKQEQFYLQQHRYARNDELALSPPAGLGLSSSLTGYYNLETRLIAGGFSATATVKSDGLQKDDARCWLFGIDATGRRWAETFTGNNSTQHCWKT